MRNHLQQQAHLGDTVLYIKLKQQYSQFFWNTQIHPVRKIHHSPTVETLPTEMYQNLENNI